MSERRALAIVGMACQFPGANELRGLWRLVREGRTHFGEVPSSRWDHSLFHAREGGAAGRTPARQMATIGAVPGEPGWGAKVPPRRVAVMDPQQLLLLEVAGEALADAGYGRRRWAREETGVFVGASAVEHRVQAVGRLFARRLFSGEFGPAGPAPEGWAEAAVAALPEIQEYTMVGSLGNFLAAVVAQTFDLGGPAYTVDAACASGLVALHDAAQHLRSGDCGMAIVGGVYLALSPDAMVAFSRVGAISRTDSCRPFDARADGFVLGEGAGALVVKRLADARRDGDRVHAIIRGVGASNDGRGAGPMTPGERGQTRALERAYADAGVAAASVGFIEAHGTATPVGDLTEARALAAIRARGGEPCAIGSIKGNIGHAMSAAGIAGLIKAALVVAHGEIPPQAGFERERVELGLADAGLFVPRQRVELRGSRGEPRRAGVSSFGFGGTNVHVVLEGVERAGLPRGETT